MWGKNRWESTLWTPKKHSLVKTLWKGIKASKSLLSFIWTQKLSISWGLLVYRSFIFRQAAFSFFLLPPGFGSFTEKPVSYLIGVHLHSLIQQSPKSREVRALEKKKKKDCNTQCTELLIFNKTWDILRKMQSYFSPSLTLCVRQCIPKNDGRIRCFGRFDVEGYCSFPCLHYFTVVFGLYISTGMLFFSTLFISLVFRECSILSPQPNRPACWLLSTWRASSSLTKMRLSLVAC